MQPRERENFSPTSILPRMRRTEFVTQDEKCSPEKKNYYSRELARFHVHLAILYVEHASLYAPNTYVYIYIGDPRKSDKTLRLKNIQKYSLVLFY